MRISAKHLRQYCSEPLPSGPHSLRELLDDVGIEVKRVEDDGAAYAVELLANRGDHRCYAGVAREVVGRVGGSVRTPPSAELTVGDSPIPLRLETDLCLRYTATAIDISNVEQSLPDNILHPLIEAASNPLTRPSTPPISPILNSGNPRTSSMRTPLSGASPFGRPRTEKLPGHCLATKRSQYQKGPLLSLTMRRFRPLLV